ncbi:MAG TPA: hypothetical protein VGN42_18570 [Pirellulales bacterium]|jgi:hypothetical protein|nr:hypothetical protein [Pirellulales bacterium]
MLSKLAARQEVATAVRPVSGGRRRIEVRAEPDEAWLEAWREAAPKLRRLGAALGVDRRPDANVAQGGLERELIDRSAAAVSPPQGESANEARQWADLQASIEREASAARLAAAAEALAGQAATDAYAWESWRFVAETFPETRAGIDAARRVEARVRQPKEYRQ